MAPSIGLGIGLGSVATLGGGGVAFSSASLFASGEVGEEFTLSRNNCFTKTVGGIYEVVTTTGDLIARVTGLHKGINADQDTVSKRPAFGESGSIGWGEFDGVDDSLVTTSVNFTGTDEMTVLCGLQKPVDDPFAAIVELSPNYDSNAGVFQVGVLSSGLLFGSKGTSSATVSATASAPTTKVLTGTSKIADDICALRLDGAEVASSAANQGTGNFGNYAISLGSRQSPPDPFNGRLYSVIIRGSLTGGDLLSSAENYVAEKTGVTL